MLSWVSPFKVDLEALELSIKKFLSEGKQVILCGDLNCDLLRPDLLHVRSMISLINNVGMHQCVRAPTRIALSSSRLIDIFLVSEQSLVKECISHDCIVSDHNFVVVKIQVKRTKVKPKLITFRRWENIDFTALKSDLFSINWAPIFFAVATPTKLGGCGQNGYSQFLIATLRSLP